MRAVKALKCTGITITTALFIGWRMSRTLPPPSDSVCFQPVVHGLSTLKQCPAWDRGKAREHWRRNHCSGSMTFWCGSGSADPCLWLMDPDPNPAILIVDLQDAKKKLIKKSFFCLLLFGGTVQYIYIIFSKIKSPKRSHTTVGIKIFLTIFAWWQKDPDLESEPPF